MLMICSAACAQDKILVHVWVVGDKGLEENVTNYLKKELLTMGDIEIIDNPEGMRNFTIGVGCELNEHGNVVIGVVFTNSLSNSLNRNVLPHVERKWRNYARKRWQFAQILMFNPLAYFTNVQNLHGTCQRIVADFDQLVLKEARKEMRRYGYIL